MRQILSIMVLAVAFFECLAQQSRAECNVQYQNHNMIDYGPLTLRSLSGHAIDPSSVRVPGVCLGLFTDQGHKLVAATSTGQDGKFSFRGIAPGRYRLIAKFEGFCAANVPLRIVPLPRGGMRRHLVLHLEPGSIDGCSFGSYR